MDAHQPAGPDVPVWYVGHHLPTPKSAISGHTLETESSTGVSSPITVPSPPFTEYTNPSAQYDMITTHITNINFRTRVEKSISSARAENKSHFHIESLDAEEVNLHPGDHISQVIAFTSSWIDLDSDDRLIAHVSRQVLIHELEYAAFCGASNVVVAGPKRRTNVAQYAQVISAALTKGAYTQLLIHIPMAEEEGSVANAGEAYDEFAMWDVWNTIRTVCKYNARLSLSTSCLPHLHGSDILTENSAPNPCKAPVSTSRESLVC